ncbi:YeeE/YedE thiosulfate transporter family protein [Pseudomonas sp. RL_15y_Pfl2_60]|uniref:YeeE/YedE thiosulfate transporter family protein n=1 Tax=Pseudomonas sp. RL_15y_Pfl2_60 TaxID=3088709 RepID=UPI0030DD9685
MLIPLTLAFLIGWVSQRMGLCLVAAITMALNKRPTLFVALASCGLFGLLLTPLYQYIGVSLPFYQPVAPYQHIILGGFLFGVSSVLNNGCSVGTLTKLARGDLSKAFTIIGWVIGIVLWYHLNMDMTAKQPLTPSPSSFNYLLAIGLVIASLLVLVRFQREKHYVSLSILLGLLTSALYTFEPQWTPSLLFYDLSKAVWIQQWHIHPTRLGIFAMLVLGMYCFTIYRRTFDYRPINLLDSSRYLCAGTLMGVGASMMLGGNDSQILLVFPTLHLATTLPLLAICSGIVLSILLSKYIVRLRPAS